MEPEQPTRLLLVRHGESVANVERRIGGMATCSGLSDLGRRQAARLRDRVRSDDLPAVDELWSSAMPRARETAEIVNEALGLELQVGDDFDELRPGEVDGLKFSEYVERFGDIDQMAEPYRVLSPGGESRATFFTRVGVAFDQLLAARAGRSLMVVCHGGVIDVLFRSLLSIEPQAPFQMWSVNASITELLTTSHGPARRWRLARYNDAAHLGGLPERTPLDE